LATYHPNNHLITIYTRIWKNYCNEEEYPELFVNIIHHESLHGIIDSIVEIDDTEFEGQDDHWPHMNGMDDWYLE